MSVYDLNEADDNFELVPPGIYRVKARVRPGGVGDERLLRLAKSMRTCGLELELSVTGGHTAGARFSTSSRCPPTLAIIQSSPRSTKGRPASTRCRSISAAPSCAAC